MISDLVNHSSVQLCSVRDKMKYILLLLLLGSSCLCHPRPLPVKDVSLKAKVEACGNLQTFRDSLEDNFAVCGVLNEAEPGDE